MTFCSLVVYSEDFSACTPLLLLFVPIGGSVVTANTTSSADSVFDFFFSDIQNREI